MWVNNSVQASGFQINRFGRGLRRWRWRRSGGGSWLGSGFRSIDWSLDERVYMAAAMEEGRRVIILGLWFPATIFWLASAGCVVSGAFVGFNYGAQLSSVPKPQQLVSLLKSQAITNIRLYDANSSVLQALSGTGIEVMVSVPNTQLLSIGESNVSATNWIQKNVVAFLPGTNITGISVGNEVLTSSPNLALVLFPAIKFLHSALVAAKLDLQIKISTPHSTALIMDSFPPSQAFFNKSWTSVLQPMLDFFSQTGSFFMLNVYTYDIFKGSNGIISLDYALLNPLASRNAVVDSNTLLQYTSLFDAVLDSAFFAMAKLNHSDIDLVVSETGWPSKGDATDTEATTDNASTYNSNLIAHILNGTGTPRRLRASIDTFMFELFNEDLRVGPTTMKNYGFFASSTMAAVYPLRLTGSGSLLANDTTNQLYCVARPGADSDALQIALDWACGPGQADCKPVLPNGVCYQPDTVAAHASYAFDSYYQKNNRGVDTCDFNGNAMISTTNPSNGSCIYPGSSKNSTSTSNSTVANITSNSTPSGNATAPTAGYGRLSTPHIIFPFASLFLVMAITAMF